MADRGPLPLTPDPAGREALEAHAAGRISAEVALMRLLLTGLPAEAVAAIAAHTPGLAEAARRHADGLGVLERMVRAGADHPGTAGLEATQAMFDRLVALSPEASVAAYSLGDPATLAAATAELVDWLRGRGLLAGRPRVLDLGCGIGRVAAAVAPEADSVLGLDLSPAMVEAARARHGCAPGLGFATCSGRDLAGLPDAGFDLVLAVDVFPYLVQAGLDGAMLAEAARVLRPCGQLVILNFAYGQVEPGARLAAVPGFALVEAGTRPLALWDGAAFRLRRDGLEAAGAL
jgi:SAM-dependent methyltransferase